MIATHEYLLGIVTWYKYPPHLGEGIVLQSVIARSAVPTDNSCAMWAVFATHEYSLGIVTNMSLRASSQTGVAIRRAVPADISCTGGLYSLRHRVSLGIVTMLSLRGCGAAVAIRIP